MDLRYIGEEIQRVRRRRGMTQEDLATVVGVSQTHVSNIEKGKAADAETARRLCDLLEIDFSGLVAVAVGAASGAQREIREDPALNGADRDLLLKIYQIMRERGPLVPVNQIQ